MKIIEVIKSSDNMAKKYLQETTDGYITETLYVDYYDKHIICYSSQLGCKIGCSMCYNGINKNFYRNLTDIEIFKQCENIVDDLNLADSSKHILFSCMGVGEPLLNYYNVVKAINELELKYPKNKHALATTGVNLNLLIDLSNSLKNINNFKLTISLHGANEELRKTLIPLNIKLSDLINAIKEYQNTSNRSVEWNYVLLDRINDSEDDAYELIKLLDKGSKVKLNVFNPIENCVYKVSSNIETFSKILNDNGLISEYYKTNGSDINGGCGQMAAKMINKL